MEAGVEVVVTANEYDYEGRSYVQGNTIWMRASDWVRRPAGVVQACDYVPPEPQVDLAPADERTAEE